VSIVKDFYKKKDIKGACEFMVKEAEERWIKVYNIYYNIINLIGGRNN